MLPDLPELRSQLHSVMMRYVGKRAHSQLGIFKDAPKHIIHEGSSMRVIRSNGEIEDTGMMSATAEIKIDKKAVAEFPAHERIALLNSLADDMARDMATKLYGALGASLDSAGQSINNMGRPFDVESILVMLAKMEFDFDQAGQPSWPTLALHPDSIDAAHRAFVQLDVDPALRSRLDNLMAEKKVNWRDREASRKLVG